MTERYDHGHPDWRRMKHEMPPSKWTLRPGETIQAAGPSGGDMAPDQPKLGVAAALSGNAWFEMEPISARELLHLRWRHDVPPLGRPRYFHAIPGRRTVLVWPQPDQPYVATWL